MIQRYTICHHNKGSCRKPIVGLPSAEDRNQVVSMDLRKVVVLHIICVFSRLSMTVMVKSKTPDEIIHKFMRVRVGKLRAPPLQ